ncbi:Gfo/Idh/MocA family oxidoreductase [Streptomyces sp. NPDC002577]
MTIGVVGAGTMGADHVHTLHRWVSGAEVTMVADVDLERAGSVAAAVGARATGDAHALIADPDVDALSRRPQPREPAVRRC